MRKQALTGYQMSRRWLGAEIAHAIFHANRSIISQPDRADGRRPSELQRAVGVQKHVGWLFSIGILLYTICLIWHCYSDFCNFVNVFDQVFYN